MCNYKLLNAGEKTVTASYCNCTDLIKRHLIPLKEENIQFLRKRRTTSFSVMKHSSFLMWKMPAVRTQQIFPPQFGSGLLRSREEFSVWCLFWWLPVWRCLESLACRINFFNELVNQWTLPDSNPVSSSVPCFVSPRLSTHFLQLSILFLSSVLLVSSPPFIKRHIFFFFLVVLPFSSPCFCEVCIPHLLSRQQTKEQKAALLTCSKHSCECVSNSPPAAQRERACSLQWTQKNYFSL